MTSPTYEEQANQFNELMEIARRSYDPLYREEVLHALLAMGTKFAESQAENARLTGELDELLARFLTLAARRDAAQEQVRIYAETVRDYCGECDALRDWLADYDRAALGERSTSPKSCERHIYANWVGGKPIDVGNRHCMFCNAPEPASPDAAAEEAK